MKRLLLTLSIMAALTTGFAEKEYSSELATTITSGRNYQFVVKMDTTYKAGKAVGRTTSSGYLSLADCTLADGGGLNTKEMSCFYTFTEVEGGYTIQDIYERYLFLNETSGMFQVSSQYPATGAIWSVDIADGGTTITNVDRQKYVQYIAANSGFGAMASAIGTLPLLYEYTGSHDVEEGDGDLVVDQPVDGNYFVNGGFESWTDGQPDNWQSLASKATLEQSSEAYTGTSSVCVKNNETSNQRLSYKELVLGAGDYTFTCYGKAPEGATSAKMRLGFAKWVNSNSSYKWSSNIVLNSTEWTKGEYVISLYEPTKVTVCVMNPYGAGDLLIDEATLTSPNASGLDHVGQPQETVIYNICGERVSNMNKPGIYIVNGRKVLSR